VGNVLARMGPEDSLLVLSDHGYGPQEKGRGADAYGHASGRPPGVIYLYGKEFKRGATVSDATVYDVMPTVMRVCGFPLAQELEGHSLEEALSDEFRAEHPPLEPVKTYGPRQKRTESAVMSAEVDKTVTDHLRALGYLD
jgi:arylsulfatase A-like enzyme